MSEREEDQILLEDEQQNEEGKLADAPSRLTVQPANVINCTMRHYQIEGLNWLIQLYRASLSGILGVFLIHFPLVFSLLVAD